MPNAARIALYLEDLPQLATLLESLTPLGYVVRAYNSVRDLIRALTVEGFDLVVLGTPQAHLRAGTAVSAGLVRAVQAVPVLQVVEDGWQESIVHMDETPDDFMVLPVRVAEMRARIQKLLRTNSQAREVSMVRRHGRYTVDMALKVIRRDNRAIELRPREFEVGQFMFRNVGKVVPRAHLLLAVWNMSVPVETRSVDTHIWRLRVTLGLDGSYGYRLGSVYNRGYRLDAADSVEAPN